MTNQEYKVEIQALWDGTKLKAGSEEAERSIEGLADAVDVSADNMRRSLQSIDDGVSSTFGPSGSFDRSVTDFESTGGSRMGEAGTEVAAEFSSNLAEGISSGDTSATLLDSITGLGATLGAAGGTLAFAGVGALLGGGLVSGMIRGARQKRQEFIDSVSTLFSQLEVEAATSMRNVRKQIVEGFDFETTLTELGGGDLGKGIDLLKDKSIELGVPWQQLLDVMQGDITPQNERILELLQKQTGETTDIIKAGVVIGEQTTNEATTAKNILDFANDTLSKKEALQRASRTYRADLQYEADKTGDIAYNYERSAAASKQMWDYTNRIGGTLGTAVRNANLLDLALNGVPK